MIKNGLKLIVNIVAACIIFLLPTMLISSVSDAGYFAEMFVSVYIGKLVAYILSILLISIGVNKMIDSIKFDDNQN